MHRKNSKKLITLAFVASMCVGFAAMHAQECYSLYRTQDCPDFTPTEPDTCQYNCRDYFTYDQISLYAPAAMFDGSFRDCEPLTIHQPYTRHIGKAAHCGALSPQCSYPSSLNLDAECVTTTCSECGG